MRNIKVFALNGSKEFGKEVVRHIGLELSTHEEYCFEDGECYCASAENVRGKDVFVICSLFTDEQETVSQKLMKLLIFLGSLRDASAKRVTLTVPYLSFARQDRKCVSRGPISTKYVARMFKSLWADRLLSLDVHNPTAIQNAYQIPCDLLEAKNLFAVHVRDLVAQHKKELVVLSPDSGGLDRARKFRRVLSDLLKQSVSIACMDKEHVGKEIKGYNVISSDPIAGKSVIIYDDMVSSGKTVLECCEACQRNDAHEVLSVCSPHGLFVGKANTYLDTSFLKNIFITDTIKPFRLTNPVVRRKLSVISTTRLFAEAIVRIHQGTSISDLIDNHLPT